MSWKDIFPKENRYFETDNGILYNGDCLELLKEFPEDSIDLVLVDPPYLINYKTNRRKDKNHSFCTPIQNDSNHELISQFIKLSYNLLKTNRAFYCFASWKTVDFFKQEIEKHYKLKNQIIWVKNNWTAGDLKAQYAQQYEIIMYANKGRAFINGKRYSDVWHCNRVSGKYQVHQNQKPIELIELIINKHSKENNIVLDSFLGSGTTAIACEKLNRRWIGIELNEEYCEIAKARLSAIETELF